MGKKTKRCLFSNLCRENMTQKQIAQKALEDWDKIMNELGIIYWLDGGTLLGAVRDGDFPEGDEDDIDLGTWFNYSEYKEEIKKKAFEKGFELYHEWEYQLAFKRNGTKIDFFFHRKKGKDAVHCIYKGNKCIPAVVPVKYFELLDSILFYGEEYLRPYFVLQYLEYKYGDWKTPIDTQTYRARGGCYDPSSNKALRPDYEI